MLDPKTWERDARLVETANALRKELGGDRFEDHNLFRDRVGDALRKLGIKLTAADLKFILRTVSWRVETAPPVIAKREKLKSGQTILAEDQLWFLPATRIRQPSIPRHVRTRF